MNPLIQLKKLGQSVWYDVIRRGLITSGELKRMISEYGIMGVTSNPTIFEKAISGTAEYDEEISGLIRKGLGDAGIINELMIEDIRRACDTLTPAYREAQGRDGFVSIEVRPAYARDTKASIEEARRFFSLVDRPNLMVKVPGTVEGLPAIEELTYEGRNINITLLFSVNRYEEVAWAYIGGLERRVEEGKPVDGISSVASFFVSRVDTLADKIIEGRIERSTSNDEKARLRNLLGKAAIANAKLAYIKYREIFSSERFRRLKEKGASEQRLLWASTGTKNPHYSDIKYVEALIEKGTVNTMPLQTLLAYYDHGKPRLTLAEGLEEAARIIQELSDLCIDYKEMTSKLEEDGIKSFASSYDSLARCIAEKRKALLEKRAYAIYAFDGFEPDISEALEEMEKGHFLERLWAKDPTLWKTDPEHKKLIKHALGWLTLPDVMESRKDSIIEFAKEVRDAGFRHVVLLGMGGSSLAPLVMKETFGAAPGYPELIVLDSTDPEAVKGVERAIDIEKTLFIVSSKSGSTIEPLSFFEYFYKKLSDIKGEEAGSSFIAITDPGTPLEGFSRKYRFRRLFLNPGDIGGRFSALSYFGLVPAALSGIDISRLLDAASTVSAATHPCASVTGNPVVLLGAALGALASSGRDKVTFFLSDEIGSFGLWIEQLIAESTGKEGKGLVPVTGEPMGRPEDYGSDRVFVHVAVGSADKNIAENLKAVEAQGHPVLRFYLKDLYGIGGEFLRWEVATAAAGAVMGINPFDQPDVELAKKLTVARLNAKREKGVLGPPGIEIKNENVKAYFGRSTFERIGKKGGDLRGAIRDLMGLVKEGDYLGVLAYYNPADKRLGEDLVELRRTLRDSTKAATQFGYGPRYLHSTGQLHKGGADKGVFIILCHETKEDLDIPGCPFSFSELELSQAFGDMEALDSKGRSVAIIELKDPSVEALREVGRYIKEAVSGIKAI